MNNNTTHTIMESPIWINRHNKIWLTLFLTYFIMFALSPLIALISTIAFVQSIWFTVLPILIAVYVDERFTQKFDIPAWERSYQDDHMNIRGIPIPKIRERIMWQIIIRKKILHYLSVFNLTIALTFSLFIDEGYILGCQIVIIVLTLFFSTLATAYIALQKFGFSGSYFADTKTFKSTNHRPPLN
ncbi:MAG: hypothetical protein Q8Q56_01050 [Alphaproteobacteria bacterium]|nr:hypothetical protein [Alphaproteobacteria bacterium]